MMRDFNPAGSTANAQPGNALFLKEIGGDHELGLP